ncbi:MAG TPA: MarR family transcriptional regulator [Candidatus Dormibacteraeota bacterium]|nr:MarR family transcriptional regulator [Candidatus Dormibacteraeota bacterium]
MPRRNLHAPVRVSTALQREFPQMDRRATEALINLIRTDSLVTTALSRRFRRHGLSLSGFNALVILRQAPAGVNPHEIADRLLVTRAAVTAILNGLEAKGLARRNPSGSDGRMTFIEITATGRKLLDRLLPEHFAAERAMASVLGANEKELLVSMLGRLQLHLGAMDMEETVAE